MLLFRHLAGFVLLLLIAACTGEEGAAPSTFGDADGQETTEAAEPSIATAGDDPEVATGPPAIDGVLEPGDTPFDPTMSRDELFDLAVDVYRSEADFAAAAARLAPVPELPDLPDAQIAGFERVLNAEGASLEIAITTSLDAADVSNIALEHFDDLGIATVDGRGCRNLADDSALTKAVGAVLINAQGWQGGTLLNLGFCRTTFEQAEWSRNALDQLAFLNPIDSGGEIEQFTIRHMGRPELEFQRTIEVPDAEAAEAERVVRVAWTPLGDDWFTSRDGDYEGTVSVVGFDGIAVETVGVRANIGSFSDGPFLADPRESAIGATSSPVEVIAALDSAWGATDDLSGVVAQFVPFPIVEPLPDVELNHLRVSFEPPDPASAFDTTGSWQVEIGFWTTGTAEEVTRALDLRAGPAWEFAEANLMFLATPVVEPRRDGEGNSVSLSGWIKPSVSPERWAASMELAQRLGGAADGERVRSFDVSVWGLGASTSVRIDDPEELIDTETIARDFSDGHGASDVQLSIEPHNGLGEITVLYGLEWCRLPASFGICESAG